MALSEVVAFHAADLFDDTTSAADTAGVATLAAPGTESRLYITGILVSMSATPTTAPVITIKSGTTTLWTITLPAVAAVAATPLSIQFQRPLKCGVNETATVTCGALGAAIISYTNISGFKAGN